MHFYFNIFQTFQKLTWNKFALSNMIYAFCVCSSPTVHPIENRRIQYFGFGLDIQPGKKYLAQDYSD